MLGSLRRWLMPTEERRAAHRLYLSVVEASRNPYFFAAPRTGGAGGGIGVPDTLDGRFELILLHQFLVLECLKAGHGGVFEKTQSAFERELIEVMFDDFDRSLRELGIGDMGVGRRMKKMANAFYGRLDAYGSAKTDAELEDALNRNALATVDAVQAHALGALRRYVRRAQASLRSVDVATVRDAAFDWPSPAAP